jgi:hypothetical protein
MVANKVMDLTMRTSPKKIKEKPRKGGTKFNGVGRDQPMFTELVK